MKIPYIHGFNSSSKSNTKNRLEEALEIDVIPLEWECNNSYNNNLKSLYNQIKKINSDFLIIGSSTGSFYADHLTNFDYIRGLVLFNPVINPKKQLSNFLGKNKNFSTGEEYLFTPEILNSYDNIDINYETINRVIFIGKNDNILDNKETKKFYKNRAYIKWVDEGHIIENFEPYKNDILEMFNLIGG
ncbi:MAG: YqiA/YcfP family alpha/beta fold hydrolase, partial [Nanoarchaeota archaeon]